MYRMILNETSYFGAGCRETIAVEAMRRGFKKAFFVTDKDLIKFKVADKIIEVFEKNHIPYELFCDVKANLLLLMCRKVWMLLRHRVLILLWLWVEALPLIRQRALAL